MNHKQKTSLETWYTCPRCGSLIHSGVNCDCGFSPDFDDDFDVQEIVETYIQPLPSDKSKNHRRKKLIFSCFLLLFVLSVFLSAFLLMKNSSLSSELSAANNALSDFANEIEVKNNAIAERDKTIASLYKGSYLHNSSINLTLDDVSKRMLESSGGVTLKRIGE